MMLSFSREQEIVEVGGVALGGQPGELPTVLFGTVFYRKQFREIDRTTLGTVESLVNGQAAMSDLTGNPAIVDIFLDDSNFERRIDAVASLTDGPLSLDVPEVSLWPEVLSYADDAGLLGRTIANSLNMGLNDGALAAFSEHTPAAAILLGFDPRDMSADGRIRMIRDGAGYLERGLLEIARDLGMGPLLDTAATPFDHNACETIRAIPVIKNSLGLPVGCAIHNTVESWLWMRDYRKEHRDTYLVCDMAANVLPMAFGADFIIYGPIDNAPVVFPMAAMVDKFIAEGAEDYFGVTQSNDHPRRRLP